jgi:polysaccharide deacetylase 2 family uncharacterized protein YibQ
MKKTVKRRKITRKTYKKRKKTGYSSPIQAFLLVGIIVAISALISCAVIAVHSKALQLSEDSISDTEKYETVSISPEKHEPVSTADEILETAAVSTEKFESAAISTEKHESVLTSNEVFISSRSLNETSFHTAVEQPIQVQPQNPTPVAATVSAVITPKIPVENKGTLVFIIDDAGNNLRELEPFLRIQFPFTIAVLPGLPYSAEAARLIRESGKEVILHQPMEALGGQEPGPGAIYSNMSAAEIRAVLSRNIDEVGPVAGINNHQGSKITMDKEAMQTILAFCNEKGIYFIDSRTTADTVASVVAKQMGIKIAERNIFIDNEQNKDAMLRYITGGLTRAQRNGSAVMIGHTWSLNLASLLAEQFPGFVEQGYTLKSASDIIK